MDEKINKDDLENYLYPIFVKLHEIPILIVGGGNVALEKLTSILGNSPRTDISLVASKISDAVKKFTADYPNCKLTERAFEENDLHGKALVICAADDKELHKHIKMLAAKYGILVNVADTPDLCDFYLGSIVKKGNLKIAISTNGKSPTIAKRIKELLEDAMPNEIDQILNKMQKIRDRLKGNFTEKVKALNELTENLIKK